MRGLLVTLLLVGVSVPASAAEMAAFKSGVFDPPRAAPDFELQGSNGAPLKLSDHRGRVVILEFGFTYCPKVCPVTLTKLVSVFNKLGDAAKDVQLVFVSVDPKRDSPERMREFLKYFNPSFLGATGDPKKLEAVRTAYGVVATEAASENKQLGYEVHHSSSLFLIDREGKIRALAPFGKSADDVAHDVKLLVQEKK